MQPSPAIVAQDAVRRLPRWALWLCCLAYVLAGFLGRQAWRNPDISALGVMSELASGDASWLSPTLAQIQPEVDALLPYWIGAVGIALKPDWISPDMAARLPFMVLLLVTLAATWYASYHLARSPMAQPVSFAFGGEAHPIDYARAIADGSVLACIACLGLAQLGHETTPALVQLCATATLLYAMASLRQRGFMAIVVASLSMLALTLSGAPTLALLLGGGAGVLQLLASTSDAEPSERPWLAFWLILAIIGVNVALAQGLDLWRWRIADTPDEWDDWRRLGQLWVWFTWPAGPLVLWALWKWRRQWISRHIAGLHILLPLWFVLVCSLSAVLTSASDRSLLLTLPAMASLAAFALPTLRRSVAALIDWFTLIFFTGSALIIWVVWLSMQTGLPAQPARNVARLAPGFVHEFSWGLFVLAVFATVSWLVLIRWRIGRHRTALWKSLALPAGGAVTCWVLLMTLWLPLLDYARSYQPMATRVIELMGPADKCVAMQGLKQSQIAALQLIGHYRLQPLQAQSTCPWLIVAAPGLAVSMQGQSDNWTLHGTAGHPASKNEQLFIYRR